MTFFLDLFFPAIFYGFYHGKSEFFTTIWEKMFLLFPGIEQASPSSVLKKSQVFLRVFLSPLVFQVIFYRTGLARLEDEWEDYRV